MSFGLRVLLIVGAIAMLALVLANIKRARIRMSDSIFWVVMAAVLVLIALFPTIPTFFSSLIGFQSTSNFVFLITVAILYWHGFKSDLKLSQLASKVEKLAQDRALEQS